MTEIELTEAFEESLPSYIDVEAVKAYMYLLSLSEDEFSVDEFEEAYQGQYSSDEDFAYQTADDLDLIPSDVRWPASCIDWKHAARELMYDYMSHDGHYFRQT